MLKKLVIRRLEKEKDMIENVIDHINEWSNDLREDQKSFKVCLNDAKMEYLDDYYALERAIQILKR